MDLGVRSMHRWRRGMAPPCPWETPVCGLPSCMCWGISFRALGSWLPPSSSTSRYCDRGCLSLPPSAVAHPLLVPSASLATASSFPASPPGSGHVSFFLSKILRVSSGSVCKDGPRASSERLALLSLRFRFFYSPSTRRPTPSALSSSLSVPLDPQLPPFEMFSASSWKVNSA